MPSGVGTCAESVKGMETLIAAVSRLMDTPAIRRGYSSRESSGDVRLLGGILAQAARPHHPGDGERATVQLRQAMGRWCAVVKQGGQP